MRKCGRQGGVVKLGPSVFREHFKHENRVRFCAQMASGRDFAEFHSLIFCGVLLLAAFYGRTGICQGPLESDESAAESVAATEADWKVEPKTDSDGVEVFTEEISDRGRQISRFRFRNSGYQKTVNIQSTRSASQIHDDFRGTVSVNASGRGVQLGLNVCFPHQKDPRTGSVLRTVLLGETYRGDNSWQELQVKSDAAAMAAQLRRLRTELQRSEIEHRGIYISGLIISVDVPPGETFVDVGESTFGPVVPPEPGDIVQTAVQDDAEKSESVTPQYIPLQADLNNILLNHRPVIIRFSPDHGEDISAFQQMGLNVVWVPDCTDQKRIRTLRDSGIAVLATPPHPEFEPGDFSKLLRGLPPLDQLCPDVSAFMLGTRVSPEELPHLLRWSRETRSADRKLERLQMVDVTGTEGAVSRELELVGIGRHGVGRAQSFGELRNLLMRKRTSGPLASPWTWVQTGPSAQQTAWRQRMGREMPYVEPEQIQHQIFAAVSAGCKGIGYWKTRAFDQSVKSDRETTAAIELANLELSLLEPMLASGRVDGHLAMQIDGAEAYPGFASGQRKRRSGLPWLNGAGNSSASPSALNLEEPKGPDAAVITSGSAMLILAGYWDQSSQYVPGEMYAQEARGVVAASETARAWQISATDLRAVPYEVLAGGLSIRIRDFDRYAAVIVTSEPDVVMSMEQQVHRVAHRAAGLYVEIAGLKYRRVLQTTERLRAAGGFPEASAAPMKNALASLEQAEHELEQKNFNEAALLAQKSLRSLRRVQSLCWQKALQGISSPSAAPHLIAFTTLPDHWKMREQILRRESRESANLIAAGDFENTSLGDNSGWQKTEAAMSGYSCNVDIFSEPSSGNSVLRMRAWLPKGLSGDVSRKRDDVTPVIVTSQRLAVRGGDIVRIRCKVRRGIGAQSRQPVLLFDSELGPENGIRPVVGSEWVPIEMFREIAPGSEGFQFAAALTTMAEIHIDDVSVTRMSDTDSEATVKQTGLNRPENTRQIAVENN